MSESYNASKEVLVDRMQHLHNKVVHRSRELVKLITAIEGFCEGVNPLLKWMATKDSPCGDNEVELVGHIERFCDSVVPILQRVEKGVREEYGSS